MGGKKTRITVLTTVLGLIVASMGLGQTITSSILGHVADSTGAQVPAAAITVTNEGTGIAANTVTDSAGAYSVSNLFAGTYAVSIAKTGFKTYKATGIVVGASATVRQDAVLQIGATKQEITVAGSNPLVQTDSATIQGTLSSTQISDLPLAVQAIDTLLSLVPGAQTAWGSSNPQTGGSTHWGGTNFTLNGIAVDDSANGGAAYSYSLGLVNLPDVGSLQEFQVQSANMNPEYRSLGSVTLVTKQGKNHFHGTAYEYVENTDLNANTFVLNATGHPRPPLNRNQFGTNLGGPIVKNKAFFFFDYAGLRQVTSSTVQVNVPSVAERTGNFSALCSAYNASGVCTGTGGIQLYNPLTGQPYSGNTIPTGSITSQATSVLGFVPLPNSPVSSPGLPSEAPNYVGVNTEPVDVNTYTTRLDYQLTQKDSLYGVYNHNTGFPWGVSQGTPPNYGNATDFGYKDESIALTEMHIFSPSTLNDARLGWFDHASIRGGQNLSFNPQSLFPQLTTSVNRGLPAFTMTGYQEVGGDYGKGYYTPEYDVQASDDLTHIHGSHTFKAGADETGYKVTPPTPTRLWAPSPFPASGQGIRVGPGSRSHRATLLRISCWVMRTLPPPAWFQLMWFPTTGTGSFTSRTPGRQRTS